MNLLREFVLRLQRVLSPFAGQQPGPGLARTVEGVVWDEARGLGTAGPRSVVVGFDPASGAIMVGFDLEFQARLMRALHGVQLPPCAKISNLGDAGCRVRERNGAFELVATDTGAVVWRGSCPAELVAVVRLLARTSQQVPS